jgi:hypothetical protein
VGCYDCRWRRFGDVGVKKEEDGRVMRITSCSAFCCIYIKFGGILLAAPFYDTQTTFDVFTSTLLLAALGSGVLVERRKLGQQRNTRLCVYTNGMGWEFGHI